MPELPEVETTVRGLAFALTGRRIARVAVNRPDLRRPFPLELVQVLTGARVTTLSRRAKYGLIGLDRGATLVFHLGMSGSWRIDPAMADRHDHLVIETAVERGEPGHRLALNDPRRFGSVDLVPTADLAGWGPLAALGPEPLGPALTAAALAQAFAGRAAPVKALLLDQRVVAGLGNIYVAEALHRAGIRPTRAAGQMGKAACTRLVVAIRAVLEEAIAAGGSTIRNYAQPNGELGYFAAEWRVYGRAGAACLARGGACGGVVQRGVQAGRATYWCPRCQR